MAPLAGFMLTAVVGMSAFSIDAGHLIWNRTQLQTSADAAALAAAGNLPGGNLSAVKAAAVDYASINVPADYGTVMLREDVVIGHWDPKTRTFIPGTTEPNAVKVTARRTVARGNPVPSFFAKIFGVQSTDMEATAIAVGAVSTSDAAYYKSVYVTSSKDLSNVVLEFEDGERQKFEPLSGFTGTFKGTGIHEGKNLSRVWIKSGCNDSDEGPGYGERIDNPDSDGTVHGTNTHKGCRPHVTATFQAAGADFGDSGALSPVRLVE